MGLHLSKKNKRILSLFTDKLRSSNTDFSLQLNSPSKLEYIIRNSRSEEEFRWIGDKWLVSVKGDRIYFKCKQLVLISEMEEDIIDNEERDFFSVFNILISQPNNTVFTNVRLTQDECDKLIDWCDSNGYIMEYYNFELRLKKNENPKNTNITT